MKAVDFMHLNKQNKYKNAIKINICKYAGITISVGFITLAILYSQIYKTNQPNIGSIDSSSSITSTINSNITSSNIISSSSTQSTITTSSTASVSTSSDDIKINSKSVALTFDDGPSKIITPQILEVLKENNCHATFFVLGNSVKNNSDIIKNIYDNGNEIGNHGLNHTAFNKLSTKELQNQINTTNNYIYDIINEYPIFVRPPYGTINDTIKSEINQPFIMWSIDSNDWRNLSKETIINNVLSELKDGNIILFHDTKQKTLEIIKILIPKIKEQGYAITSIKELFKQKNISCENNKSYYKAITKTK